MGKITLRRFTSFSVALLVMGCAMSLLAVPQAQKQSKQPPREESFSRPAPTGPQQPTMPSQNRWQDDKIFLEEADSLFRTDISEDIKIVKGNVKFRQGGLIMTCDSAYFYSEQDRADCFGNVRMEQGDTLFIYADRLYYDGLRHFAQLKNGATARKVRLINRSDTLITDSLDYNLEMRLGWYDKGGELRDSTSTLTSIYGQYSPATKDAEFFHDVVLINRKDNFRLLSDTLYYNTATGIARIDSRTIIEGENDTIITTGGTYNTKTGFADLTRRSLILHRDSNENVVTLEGDSIVYDRDTEISRAYRFAAPGKKSRPVVLTDTANKSILIGGFGTFNNKERTSMATDYPLLMEYSRPDTLFLRADTIRTYVIKTEPVRDSLDSIVKEADEYYLAKAYKRGRFFKQDMQGVADSITYFGLDSMLYLNRKPVVWAEERQINGEIIEIHLNDSTADWARLPQNGLMMEHVDEDFYNQLAAKSMLATLVDGALKRLEAEGNVMAIMLPQENDSSYNKLVTAESSFLDAFFADDDFERLKMWPQVDGTVTPISQVSDDGKLLRGAVWLEEIRPERRWYGDRVSWDDHLGEISDALEAYFAEGEPPAPRPKPLPAPVNPEESDLPEQDDQADQTDQTEPDKLTEPSEPTEASEEISEEIILNE
ncbi:MAG: LPS export ABC transporter periplasmic protein LptC [Muribaculaceae bacterium]|nr:LPS export ABC transporter periplasmic protein LptC [Muribaculaceae bacterium]